MRIFCCCKTISKSSEKIKITQKVTLTKGAAFVHHAINTLFVNGKKNRGDLSLGVFYDQEKNKYRVDMSFMGETIKLGTFDSAEDAFARYKECKEDFIKDIAEQYKDEIPDKVYQAMLNWEIEIDD